MFKEKNYRKVKRKIKNDKLTWKKRKNRKGVCMKTRIQIKKREMIKNSRFNVDF